MNALDEEFAALLDGALEPAAVTAFLERSIGIMGDPAALAAGARAMRERMVRVKAPPGAIDVCGTGGDGAHTLNISTATAFVVAGAGVPVAKHGNRAMSSKSGAADVLEALGVTLAADPARLALALETAGVAFLFAQNHHPAMRHVAPARKALGKRTIFNLLGPLSNPAGVARQLVGVYDPALVPAMAEALGLLGAERALVVCGPGGVDELIPAADAANAVGELGPQGVDVQSLDCLALAAAPCRPEDLRGGEAADNAAALRALLAGKDPEGAYARTVRLNAAAALLAAGRAASWDEGHALARESLGGGAAQRALDALIDITRSAP